MNRAGTTACSKGPASSFGLVALAALTTALLPLSARADATSILWSTNNSGTQNLWTNGSNWTGGAVPDGTQIAEFGVNPTVLSDQVGIPLNNTGHSTFQEVGAVWLDLNRTQDLMIGNSSTVGGNTTGTFQLDGVTVNSIANVILRNNSSHTLTLQNTVSTQGSPTGTMFVALGNATDNVVNIDGTGGIEIDSRIIDGNNGSAHLTFNGSGSGTFNITNGSNSYSGGTTINSGTMILSGQLGTGNLTMTGGTLQFATNDNDLATIATVTLSGSAVFDPHGTNQTFGILTGSGGTILNNFNSGITVTVGSGNATGGNYQGAIVDHTTGTGTVALTKSGTGIITLSGTNTYSGLTKIGGGMLATASGASLSSNSHLRLAGGVLGANGAFTRSLAASSAGTVDFNNGNSTNGGFAGYGTAAGFGGLNNLTVLLNNSNASPIIWAGTGGNSNFLDGGEALLLGNVGANGTVDFQNSLNLNTSGVSSRTVQVDRSSVAGPTDIDAKLSGVISGSNDFIKTGAGTLQLTNTNTYTGATIISGGILSVSSIVTEGAGGGTASGIGSSGNAAANLTLDGGTLQYTGASTSTDRLFTLTTNGGTLDASGSGAINFTNTGSITLSGTGIRTLTLTGTNTGANTLTASLGNNSTNPTSLIKNGTGTWVLSGTTANAFTGVTTVNAGELDLNKTGVQAMGGNLVISGGTVVWDQSNQMATSGSVTINSGTLNLNGQNQTVMDVKNLGGTFQTGAGNWTGTSNSMTWGASSVANTINTGGSITDVHLTVAGGTNTIQAGGTLNIHPTGTGLEMSGGTITVNSDNTTPGTISLTSNVIADDGTNSSILNGAGGTQAGNINLNGATRTFTVGTSNASTTVTVGASIIGTSGNLTKAGPGKLVLSGANTYTGTTSITAGTLNAAATGALGSTSSVTVNSGGTLLLSGSGNLNRVNNSAGITLGTPAGAAATLARSGTASEGTGAHTTNGGVTSTGANSTGLGALTLQSNSTLDFGTTGAGVVGTLVFASFTPNAHLLNIINYTTTATFSLTSGTDGTDDRLIFGSDQTANLADFSFGGLPAAEIALGGGYFEIVPIPEPSTWAIAALATLMLSVQIARAAAFSRTRERNPRTSNR